MSDEDLFHLALETPTGERPAFLDRACAGDGDRRRRVDALLRSHETPDSFLAGPAAGPGAMADLDQDLTADVGPGRPGGEITDRRSSAEGPGSQIGPYKLLQQLGEGGMGTVFMAEQTQPVRRRVALKVIKAGTDSRQVIARFEAERQALALMDHVNIARVLDAGATASGRPYFVMELVHGVPITQYCDDNRLAPRQRLELFVPVCHAIQHAHQKGIIHRDIKPSNVMVTLYDGKPVPKVIDFGVAKATEQKLTERTLFTQYGTIVGTLEYMSPEQAEMSALGVDTRSDIYSLGVLLYELLTGNTPLSYKRMKEAALGEILRMIKEEEPPKPSTRLSDSGEALASISANRHTEPAKLSKLMRGELDWIVMRSLEKDRDRRYETASAFAADVQRYLNDEAVQACPPSAGYRFGKFARRNNRAVLAVSLILLTLVAGVIGTTRGLIRAKQQRLVVARQRNELAERNRALQAAHEHVRLLNERARQAIETVTSETAIEQLTREKELRPEQKDFLDKMIQYYAESTQEGAATEQERSRQAQAYFRMGRLNQILGRSQESENAYRRAVALGRQLVADLPTRPEFLKTLAGSHNSLGLLLSATGRLTEAEAAYADALVIYRQLAAAFPDRPDGRQAMAGSHSNLGNLLFNTGRPKEAEATQSEALAIRKQLAASFPDRFELRKALAGSHNNLGWLFHSTGRLKEAESAYAESLAIYRQLAASLPDSTVFRMGLAKSQINLGNVLRDTGRPKEAEAAHAEALAIYKQVDADFPNRPEFRQELASGLNSKGWRLRDSGHLKEAEAAYAEALAIYKKLAADFPNVSDYHNDAAGALINLANAAGIRRDFAAARQWVDEALPYHQAALQANPRHPDYRSYYRNNLVELTQSCAGQGDRPAALAAAAKRRDLGWDPAVDAYEAACMLALCVPIVEKDDKIDAAKRKGEKQFYTDQAMTMLRDALAKGYKNADQMKKDPSLVPLREREDFNIVVAELEAAERSPPKKP